MNFRGSLVDFAKIRVAFPLYLEIPLGSRGDVPVESAYIRRSSGPIRQSAEIQRDGLESVAYDAASNRVTTPGFQYDLAGNLTRSLTTDGAAWQRCQYDAAGRMKTVTDDAGNAKQDNGFTSSNQRLFRNEPNGSGITWYVWEGEQVIAEYTSQGWNTSLTWSKSYIYAGSRLLSTYTNNGQGGQTREFHHADRLGTRVVTNPQTGTSFEQTTLPFGNVLASETSGTTNQPFTSYDRSQASGLDYANNRTYDSGQGRFTQVDPIGMGAASAGNPQSLNLYAYTQNDPINFVDPSGLNMAGPNTRYGGLDPMGVAYYVDGALSNARTAWGIIESGAGWLDYANVAGISYATFGYWENDQWVRDHQYIWVSGFDNVGAGGDFISGGGRGDDCDNAKLVALAIDVSATYGTNTRHVFAPEFARTFSAALRELNSRGIVPQINSDFRTEADQERMRSGGSGSNPAAKGISLHQTGNAVDINGTRTSNFKIVREVMANYGFTWGGSFNDRPHFELNPYGKKRTKDFASQIKAAAAAAQDYYYNREFTCFSN